jgi:hypothetical protein
MSNNGNNGVVLVNSRQTPTEIKNTGGVIMPTPRVNKQRIETSCKYVMVCNTEGTAFLIGTIAAVMWVNGQGVLRIDSYAEINKPNMWNQHGNKYGFGYFDNPSQLHVYAGKLAFKSVKNGAYVEGYDSDAAKKAVSGGVDFGVEWAPEVKSIPQPSHGEKKRSLIVTARKPKAVMVHASQKVVNVTMPASNQAVSERIAELKAEIAQLENQEYRAAQRKQIHALVDEIAESKLERVYNWLKENK